MGDTSDRLRNISRLVAEQDPAPGSRVDPPRGPALPADRLAWWRAFLRFSTRQFMVLLVTLSICIAVNRHNHIGDLGLDFGFVYGLVTDPLALVYMAPF